MSDGETGQSGDDSPAVTLGKITAQPNPLPFDMSVPLTLRWETNASEAEVYVAEEGAPEKLLTRGKFGSREVNWIPAGRSYCFRLYTGSDRQLLDEVVVDVAAIPWRKLLERVTGAPEGREYTDGLAEFIGGVLPGCLRRPEFPAWFRRWENSGVHVTPVQFYEPIPDSRTLKDELWTQVHELVGIDMNEPMQLHLLKEICPRFQEECDRIPMESAQAGNGFYLKNGHFQSVDPLVAYCLVRHFRPRQIIEVGGGYSTLLLALAARKNGTTVCWPRW